MELVYAALLLHSADREVNEENVTGVLEGAGLEADSSQVKALLAALEDVDIEDAMNTAVATGAAPAAGGADSGGSADADAEADNAEEEAEEEEDDASEEEAAEGLGSLF